MRIKREMTITHADFFRILPKALGNGHYIRHGNTVTFDQPDYQINIYLSDERRRNIAGLELPVTDIEIHIEGCELETAERVLKRFELSYQKGGG